jgi:hypothetical protein
MPVRIVDIANGNGCAFICEGAVTGEELISANNHVLSTETRLQTWLFCIVDHTHATSTDYRSHEIQRMAAQDKRMSLITAKGFLVAVVSPKDVQFGLSRMWQILSESTGWEINVFRDRATAEAWLAERANMKFNVKISTFD